MGSMKEQQNVRLPYIPICGRKIIEGLDGISGKQLVELGISEGLLFMIRRGYAKQLRQDVFNKLSHALNLDISPETSPHKQSEE